VIFSPETRLISFLLAREALKGGAAMNNETGAQPSNIAEMAMLWGYRLAHLKTLEIQTQVSVLEILASFSC
jgi:hypothetical protein